MHKFKRICLLVLIILLSVSSAQAVTRGQFIAGLLNARGLDWSNSPEAAENNPAGFMLRTGYISDTVNNLSANVTRREALRWCIESLGLTFEAGLLSDYPSGFKDAKSLTEFERGCLVAAINMNPELFTKSDNFKGNNALTSKEAETLYKNVRMASRNFTLDMIRNPLKGLRIYIHREGVPTGIPSWRFYAGGIRTKTLADIFRNSLKSEGYEVSLTGSGTNYGIRTQKVEDYDRIRRLVTIAEARGLNYKILPSMTNPNTRIVPKFWVMLTIDPSYWKISPVFSQNGPREFRTLSSISANNGTGAAINAGFFSVTKAGRGFPIGALRKNGRNISEPYDNRGTLAWNDNDEAVFAVSDSEEISGWYDMTNIIQAGPLILDEGVPVYSDEGFNNALISARHPRSAVGLNSNGEWVFFLVDGRNGMHSSGATISELTEIMRGRNILYALNLDGGGSSEIIINGRIYNIPSDGYERMISYALGAISLE